MIQKFDNNFIEKRATDENILDIFHEVQALSKEFKILCPDYIEVAPQIYFVAKALAIQNDVAMIKQNDMLRNFGSRRKAFR